MVTLSISVEIPLCIPVVALSVVVKYQFCLRAGLYQHEMLSKYRMSQITQRCTQCYQNISKYLHLNDFYNIFYDILLKISLVFLPKKMTSNILIKNIMESYKRWSQNSLI